MFAVVAWSAFAVAGLVLGGLLAALKRRDVSAWTAWGFLLPPAVLLMLLAPRNAGPRPRRPSLDELDAAF